MGKVDKTINSKRLVGFTHMHVECYDHPNDGNPQGTGNMFHNDIFEDMTDARGWTIEYKCSKCDALLRNWNIKAVELIRQALKDEGIIKE